MSRTRLTKPTTMIAGLIVGLLFATLTVPLGAQPVPTSRAGRGLGPFYDSTREVTLTGDIQSVATKHVVGSPAGMSVKVASAQGLVNAHLGPFLTKEVAESLHLGTPVEIVGATVTTHGKSLFLARLVKVGGTTITVRNKNGILMRPERAQTRHTTVKPGKFGNKDFVAKGGAQ
jgi:hypothetical protein